MNKSSKSALLSNSSWTKVALVPSFLNSRREQKWQKCLVENWLYLLRYMNSSDHCRPEHLLLSHHELLEKINSDVVVRRQEDADVACKEVVDFALATILRRKLFWRNLGQLSTIVWNLLHILVVAFHYYRNFLRGKFNSNFLMIIDWKLRVLWR